MSKIIAFQGQHGAYHEMAARKIYPEAKMMPCETFITTFKTIQDKKADLAIIAVDLSLIHI